MRPSPATPSTTAPDGIRDHAQSLTPRAAARVVARVLDAYGIPRHPAEVRHIAARLVAGEHTEKSATAYLRNAFGVLDPTGETAARNVDRAGLGVIA